MTKPARQNETTYDFKFNLHTNDLIIDRNNVILIKSSIPSIFVNLKRERVAHGY